MHPNAREIARQRVIDWKQKTAANTRLTQQQIDGEVRNEQVEVTRRAVVIHKRFSLWAWLRKWL